MTPTHIQAVPVGSYSVQIPILVILGKNPHGMLSFRGRIIHAILFQVNTIKLVHLYTQLWPPAAQLAGVQEREELKV